MNESEASTQRRIWAALGSGLSRLFRLNSGVGWISAMGPRGVHRLADGSVHIEAARPIALGLAKPDTKPVRGPGDLIGLTQRVITPEMVGRKAGIFTSVEVKREKGGRVSDEQDAWASMVDRAGGIAVIARSPEQAVDAVESWKGRSG